MADVSLVVWIIIAVGIVVFALLAIALVGDPKKETDYTVGVFVFFLVALVAVIWLG